MNTRTGSSEKKRNKEFMTQQEANALIETQMQGFLTQFQDKNQHDLLSVKNSIKKSQKLQIDAVANVIRRQNNVIELLSDNYQQKFRQQDDNFRVLKKQLKEYMDLIMDSYKEEMTKRSLITDSLKNSQQNTTKKVQNQEIKSVSYQKQEKRLEQLENLLVSLNEQNQQLNEQIKITQLQQEDMKNNLYRDLENFSDKHDQENNSIKINLEKELQNFQKQIEQIDQKISHYETLHEKINYSYTMVEEVNKELGTKSKQIEYVIDIIESKKDQLLKVEDTEQNNIIEKKLLLFSENLSRQIDGTIQENLQLVKNNLGYNCKQLFEQQQIKQEQNNQNFFTEIEQQIQKGIEEHQMRTNQQLINQDKVVQSILREKGTNSQLINQLTSELDNIIQEQKVSQQIQEKLNNQVIQLQEFYAENQENLVKDNNSVYKVKQEMEVQIKEVMKSQQIQFEEQIKQQNEFIQKQNQQVVNNFKKIEQSILNQEKQIDQNISINFENKKEIIYQEISQRVMQYIINNKQSDLIENFQNILQNHYLTKEQIQDQILLFEKNIEEKFGKQIKTLKYQVQEESKKIFEETQTQILLIQQELKCVHGKREEIKQQLQEKIENLKEQSQNNQFQNVPQQNLEMNDIYQQQQNQIDSLIQKIKGQTEYQDNFNEKLNSLLIVQQQMEIEMKQLVEKSQNQQQLEDIQELKNEDQKRKKEEIIQNQKIEEKKNEKIKKKSDYVKEELLEIKQFLKDNENEKNVFQHLESYLMRVIQNQENNIDQINEQDARILELEEKLTLKIESVEIRLQPFEQILINLGQNVKRIQNEKNEELEKIKIYLIQEISAEQQKISNIQQLFQSEIRQNFDGLLEELQDSCQDKAIQKFNEVILYVDKVLERMDQNIIKIKENQGLFDEQLLENQFLEFEKKIEERVKTIILKTQANYSSQQPGINDFLSINPNSEMYSSRYTDNYFVDQINQEEQIEKNKQIYSMEEQQQDKQSQNQELQKSQIQEIQQAQSQEQSQELQQSSLQQSELQLIDFGEEYLESLKNQSTSFQLGESQYGIMKTQKQEEKIDEKEDLESSQEEQIKKQQIE